MSIYATLWEIKVPHRHDLDDEWITVTAQAVPPHIGHPSHYPEGDIYADFLPPVVPDYDPETGEEKVYRAVVLIAEGREEKEGQRYIDPLIVLTGEEYARIPFEELLRRIHKALGWDKCRVRVTLLPNGERRVVWLTEARD